MELVSVREPSSGGPGTRTLLSPSSHITQQCVTNRHLPGLCGIEWILPFEFLLATKSIKSHPFLLKAVFSPDTSSQSDFLYSRKEQGEGSWVGQRLFSTFKSGLEEKRQNKAKRVTQMELLLNAEFLKQILLCFNRIGSSVCILCF